MTTTVTQVKDCEHGHDGYSTKKFCVTCAMRLFREVLMSPSVVNEITGRTVISVDAGLIADLRALLPQD